MMVTEVEAKAHWCPMGHTRYGNRNILGSPKESCLCLASKCMMWRWNPERADKITGYCGLADRPGQ